MANYTWTVDNYNLGAAINSETWRQMWATWESPPNLRVILGVTLGPGSIRDDWGTTWSRLYEDGNDKR